MVRSQINEFYSPLLLFLAAVVFGLFLETSRETRAGGGCGFNERAEQHCAVNVVEIILLWHVGKQTVLCQLRKCSIIQMKEARSLERREEQDWPAPRRPRGLKASPAARVDPHSCLTWSTAPSFSFSLYCISISSVSPSIPPPPFPFHAHLFLPSFSFYAKKLF